MKRRKGFTLLELLVVIGIVSLLIGLMLPALSQAGQEGERSVCASNLRQMAIAALAYASSSEGRFPLAWELNRSEGVLYVWDITMRGDIPEPGLLWSGSGDIKVHQCPSFTGKANTDAPYTGYNYNASYLGGYRCVKDGFVVQEKKSASLDQIQNPSQCALFGDGEYGGGANKYMRSPELGALDTDISANSAGTQCLRHGGKTNVAFCDGHVEVLNVVYTKNGKALTGEGETGYLSPDNSLYDYE